VAIYLTIIGVLGLVARFAGGVAIWRRRATAQNSSAQ